MASTKATLAVLKQYLRSLSKKKCWSVVAGSSTGSMVTLDFGDRIPRKRPMKNPNLSPEQRGFVGEFSMYLQDAAWRLDGRRGPICSSSDDNDLDGPMVTGLRQLKGRVVKEARIRNSVGDLELAFNGEHVLHVFCVQTNSEDDVDNYSLYAKRKIVSVGPKARITVENNESA